MPGDTTAASGRLMEKLSRIVYPWMRVVAPADPQDPTVSLKAQLLLKPELLRCHERQ